MSKQLGMKMTVDQCCPADWEAVRRDPRNIHYVKNPPPDLCFMAIEMDFWAIECIKNPTPEMCALAFSNIKEGYSGYMPYVEGMTLEAWLMAFEKNPYLFKFTYEEEKRLEDLIVRNGDGLTMGYDPDDLAYELQKFQLGDIRLEVLKRNPELLKYIDNPSPEMVAAANAM